MLYLLGGKGPYQGIRWFVATDRVGLDSLSGDIDAEPGDGVPLLPFFLTGDVIYIDATRYGALSTTRLVKIDTTNRTLNVDGALSCNQLVLPHGADPTLAGVGDVALDTTNSELLYYDGTAVRVLHHVQAVNFCIGKNASVGWDNQTIPLSALNQVLASTIIQVDLTAIGTGTPTLAVNIEERAFGSYNSAGTVITAAAMTAVGAGLSVTTFSNAGIAARAGLFLTTGASAESGTVNFLMGTIYFTRDRT